MLRRSGTSPFRRLRFPAAPGDPGAARHGGSVEPAAARPSAVGSGPAATAVAPGDSFRPQQPDERRDLPVS